MINYTYNIGAITKKTINGIENAISHVVWEKVGVDENGHRGVFKIATEFDTSEVGISTSFISYENLTKEIIISWIESVTDEEQVNGDILEEIQKSIDNEVQVYEFPWTVVETPVVDNNNETVETPVEEIIYVYYNRFWDAFIQHTIYQTIKSQAEQSLTINVAYSEFSLLILNAIANVPNQDLLQSSINNLINSLILTESEYNSLQSLFEVGNMNNIYTLPIK